MDAKVAPAATKLMGNHPNPFNPSTSINYALSEDGFVSLKVYNTLGEEVASLVNEYQVAGTRSAVWNGRNDAGASVASGIYIYRLTAGNVVLTEKMLFVK
jgi:flagellar hook assembly protein FlgD